MIISGALVGAAPSTIAPTLVVGVAVAAPTRHASAGHAKTHYAKHRKHYAKHRKHYAKHHAKHHAKRSHLTTSSSPPHHDINTPDTTLTSTPQNPIASTSASFSFTGTDDVGVAGYECSLDGAAYVSCASRTSYSSLAAAQHTFSVRARDAAGNVDPTPATFTWTITSGTGIIPAGAAGITPSGEPMPVGDIPGWHQIFADDFQTNVPLGSFPSAVSSTWGAYPDGWHDTSGNGTYNCTKVCSVHDGVLDLYIHTENGVHYVAVPYPKIPGGSSQNGQIYGRYVVRFTADPLPAYKTAWLLWPDAEIWPLNGEIDFPEGELSGTIDAFMHHQGATSGSEQDAYSTQAAYTSWHTAVIEWSPSAVNFILDGALIGQSTKYIPDTPMHWVLQTETATTPGVIPSDSIEGHVQVDWVAVYAPVR